MAKQDKLEQVLLIDPPQELKFTGPFTVPVTSYITLKNPSNDKVCFKIKTTAPKQYCVRPNSGIIDGNSEVKIGVSLQPQTPDFPGHENYKHKFMVQTMLAPGDDCDQEQMWKDMKPEKLMDSKLKCVFVSGPESGTVPPAESAGDAPALAQEKKLTKTPKAAQEGEVMRAAAAEVKSLREEESSLRQENLMLKEELLRLQRSVQMAGNTRETSDSSLPSSSQPMPLQEISPKMYIAFALIAVLVGIMLGKFLL